jgi:dihydroxy-acid dehydratase
MPSFRSRITVEGADRASHRAFLRAMGLSEEDLAKPTVGIVHFGGDQTPCNQTHPVQVDAARLGVASAGGVPRCFAAPSVSDGLSMNHEGMKFSLVSRELVSDTIEATVHGLAYDALLGFGGCDKTLPGVLMGMLRVNVPAVFLYGGSALPGRHAGRDLTVLDSYEAVGAVMAGTMDAAEAARIEHACLPTVGACGGQFTANTMAMVAEAIGMSPPNTAMIPGVYSERAAVASRAAVRLMEMLRAGAPRPREIVTREALENGAVVVAATGARPTPRCTCRRWPMRPGCASPWPTSPPSSPARPTWPICAPAGVSPRRTCTTRAAPRRCSVPCCARGCCTATASP